MSVDPKRVDTDADADAFRSEVNKSADRSVGEMHTHDAKEPKERPVQFPGISDARQFWKIKFENKNKIFFLSVWSSF